MEQPSNERERRRRQDVDSHNGMVVSDQSKAIGSAGSPWSDNRGPAQKIPEGAFHLSCCIDPVVPPSSQGLAERILSGTPSAS